MVYAVWLAGIAAMFVVLERLWPRLPEQPMFRRGIVTDLVYIVFNSEVLGMILGVATAWILRGYAPAGIMRAVPFWAQLPILLVAFDFLQWSIHNLLHRVPFLWEFHKVHHSIEEMDWIGNWRFHWVEIVVYKSLLYPFAAMLGFSPAAMFWYGVLNTVVGHFAHSNLRWLVGPLRYIVNSPEMHLWHHAHPDSGPPNRNFGITLSVWDWLFGTAHLPDTAPSRLGFAGIEEFPRGFLAQMIEPFLRWLR